MSIDKTENNTAADNGLITAGNRRLWLCAIGIALLTLLCYMPVFSGSKEFTNWDDGGYVTAQPLVTSLSSANIQKMFDPKSVVMFNYHPLTVLSLAIDYQRGFDEDLNTISIAPFVHTNMLFHLFNTILVLLFIYRLSKGNLMAAGICALLFGIHPMHVESVAWISERKDVLYCFFFLLSALTYLRYLDHKKITLLGLSVLFFILSCLCKAMAVPLPFVLLLTDYLYRRRFDIRLLLEKVPYIIVAVIMGIFTVSAQKSAIADFAAFTIPQRLEFAGAAFCTYWLKLLLPLQLSAYYPYPDFPLPALYFLAPLIALALIILPLVLLFRKDKEIFRVAVWGIGFFILMIALVLQVVSVGSALMADRYTYVSSIGLFFPAGICFAQLVSRPRFRQIAIAAGSLMLVFYAVQAYRRILVWDNSGALWADVIHQYPIKEKDGKQVNLNAKTAYKNMGDYYVSAGNYDSAFHYYNTLAIAGTRDAEVWANLGNIYILNKDAKNALGALDRSAALDPANSNTWLTRAVVLANTGNLAEGVKSLDKAIELKPGDTQARAMRTDMIRRLAK